MGGKEIAVLLILMAALFFSSGTTESTGEFIAIRTNHIRNNEFDLQAAGFVDNPAPAPEPKAPELKTLQCCLWGFGWEASLWRRPRVCKSWCWKPNPHQLGRSQVPTNIIQFLLKSHNVSRIFVFQLIYLCINLRSLTLMQSQLVLARLLQFLFQFLLRFLLQLLLQASRD